MFGYPFLLSGMLFFTACQSEENIQNPVEELIFQSGFEPGSEVVSRGSDADIVGLDLSVAEKGDWVNDFDDHPEVGNFNLQYQGGTDSQSRRARRPQ